MMPVYTRLACYSVLYKNLGRITSSKAIQKAYKDGIKFDLEAPVSGYTSPEELKTMGYKSVFIRFNRDKRIMELFL